MQNYLLICALFFSLTSHAEQKITPIKVAPAGKPQKMVVAKLPNGLMLEEYKLPNGLQLIIVPDKSAPVFTFQVWFRVGSADEKLDPKLKRTGLAHLFEHMMFRGTPRFPDQKFDELITAAGAADNNATTWVDRTNYFQSLPKERLELIFDLEADRMANLILDEKLFKTELGAVFGELKMNKDKPEREVRNLLWDTAFDVHPYKYTTMGTAEELNSFTVQEGMYFYKTYYAPNNATIIVVGDVDVAKTVRLAEKYYGKFPPQEIPRPIAPIEPEQSKPREKSATHPMATMQHLRVGYKIPDINDPDMAALELIASLLAYGDGSLLEKALVQGGYTAVTTANANQFKYPSLFEINNQLVPGKTPQEVRRLIDAKIKLIQEGKISQQDLLRARNQLLLMIYGQIGSISDLAEFLGESLMSSGNYLRGFEVLEDIKVTTLDDLERVAKTYLTPARSTQVILNPEKKGN